MYRITIASIIGDVFVKNRCKKIFRTIHIYIYIYLIVVARVESGSRSLIIFSRLICRSFDRRRVTGSTDVVKKKEKKNMAAEGAEKGEGRGGRRGGGRGKKGKMVKRPEARLSIYSCIRRCA